MDIDVTNIKVARELANDPNLNMNWQLLFDSLFETRPREDLKADLIIRECRMNLSRVNIFKTIMQDWKGTAGSEATLTRLIQKLEENGWKNTAENLMEIILTKNSTQNRPSQGANSQAHQTEEFTDCVWDDDKDSIYNNALTDHQRKFVKILKRNSAQTQFDVKGFSRILQLEEEYFLESNTSTPVFEVQTKKLLAAWLAKYNAADDQNKESAKDELTMDDKKKTLTMDHVLEQLQLSNLNGAMLEWEMYIKETRETQNCMTKGKNKKWSLLNKFVNPRILDDKGKSIIVEGVLPKQMVKGKLKPISFALKILPLVKQKGSDGTTHDLLDTMRAWNNLENHKNVLQPKRIWTECLTADDKNEIGTALKKWFTSNQLEILIWQMELCPLNLRLFLRFNNTPTSSDRMAIFLQIVDGVEFLHANLQDAGHGNLCPETILLLEQTSKSVDTTGPEIRIANKSKHKNRFSNMYKAVEFQDEETADDQEDKRPNDMFALGMILFELFCPAAQKNFIITGTSVQRKEYPSGFKSRWPRVVDIVEALLFSSHSERPTAKELLHALLDPEEFKVDIEEKEGEGKIKEFDMEVDKDDGAKWIDRARTSMTKKQDSDVEIIKKHGKQVTENENKKAIQQRTQELIEAQEQKKSQVVKPKNIFPWGINTKELENNKVEDKDKSKQKAVTDSKKIDPLMGQKQNEIQEANANQDTEAKGKSKKSLFNVSFKKKNPKTSPETGNDCRQEEEIKETKEQSDKIPDAMKASVVTAKKKGFAKYIPNLFGKNDGPTSTVHGEGDNDMKPTDKDQSDVNLHVEVEDNHIEEGIEMDCQADDVNNQVTEHVEEPPTEEVADELET